MRADQDQELAERLIFLSSDPQLSAQMGAAGQRRSERFEAGRVMEALVDAYRQVLSRSRALK